MNANKMDVSQPTLLRRMTAEFLGTAFLLATVIGSGIMAERLAGGNIAVVLLANASATGLMLVALILAFGPISAHFNPVVTLAAAWLRSMPWSEVPAYLVAQFSGAFLGVICANVMFGLPAYTLSTHVRSGGAQMFGEFIATFGLMAVVICVSRLQPMHIPYAVGAYITAAIWFTSSTSFANPAVTIARAFSDTFAGIRLTDTPGFIVTQLAGAAVATILFAWLVPVQSAIEEQK